MEGNELQSLENTDAGCKGRRENRGLNTGTGDRQQIGKASIVGVQVGHPFQGTVRGSLTIALSHPPLPSRSPVPI